MTSSRPTLAVPAASARRGFLLLAFLLAMLPAPRGTAQPRIPSPLEEFGFRMGDDRKLIDWTQIAGYFRKVDAASDRVVVQELGKSTLGRPFLLAVVSSAENIRNLDRIRAVQERLARPYGLSPDSAAILAAGGKTVVLVTLNIHSTEIASSQESVELLHSLATAADPATAAILGNTVLLLIPSLNPDGQQIVTDWYRKTVGTPAEGTSPPELYHHYAGHDNNRDWFFYNLAESRHTARVLYRDWFPEIVYDQHQMGSSGARLFLPPYEDPVNPNVPASLTAQVNLLGKYVVADLHEAGFRGVATGTVFNAFFEGTMSKTPLWHNRIGILSEAASVQIATPLWFPKGSVGGMGQELPENRTQTNHLDPWEGGWWRLRDIVDYELAVTRSILRYASTFRERIKANFHDLNARAIADGRGKAPHGYFVPADQHDPNAAVEMVNRLMVSGVRAEETTREAVVGGRALPAGSWYIPLAQPARNYVKDLLERQRYPDLKQYPGGPPKQPYDITAWSLPLQMGVEVIAEGVPAGVPTKPIDSAVVATAADPGTGSHWAVERRYNNAVAAAYELLRRGVPVFESDVPLAAGGAALPPGTFLVPAAGLSRPDAVALGRKWGVGIRAVEGGAATPVSPARIGIYQPWITSMDEGWTRLVMDNAGIPYSVLHNSDFGGKKPGLRGRFDVIILPDMGVNQVVSGRGGDGPSEPVLGTPERPAEYRGGIGDEGVAALKAFVHDGGTLLTLGESSLFAVEKLRVPARDELRGLRSEEFYAPGTILGISPDTTNPLAYGMEGSANAYFTEGQAFRLLPYTRESRIVASYDDEDVLKSGWIVGGERIVGKTAMAEIPVGKGRVVMYGFRVQHRAQSHGTFKLLLNALLRRG